jgi:hypothetical protein
MQLATLIQPNINEQIESLYQQYLALDGSERALLVILAVIYKPVGVNKLGQIVEILVSRGALPSAKQHYSLSKGRRTWLIEASFLTQNKSGGLQINPLLANRLMSDVGKQATFFSMSSSASTIVNFCSGVTRV